MPEQTKRCTSKRIILTRKRRASLPTTSFQGLEKSLTFSAAKSCQVIDAFNHLPDESSQLAGTSDDGGSC